MLKIVIGNKKYSTWSLRGWLGVKLTGAPFEEIVIGLDLPDTAANIAKYSPSGRVPALIDGGLTVWDSLAINEYLNEKFPQAQMWPAEANARALARSVSAEMHSGFQNLRNDCSMKIVKSYAPRPLRPETQADVERIVALWNQCLEQSRGPYLFGARPTIADVMYAPVVSRFRTYALPASGAAKGYLETIWSWPPMQEWVAGAQAESISAKRYED
jgi:glutathione S-transferase